MFRRLRQWMLRRFPRLRLRAICKAIHIKPYDWQRDFALLDTTTWHTWLVRPSLTQHAGRATGKTMAVMLRLLMLPESFASNTERVCRILYRDPDFNPNGVRLNHYQREYRKLIVFCDCANVPVTPVSWVNIQRRLGSPEWRDVDWGCYRGG